MVAMHGREDPLLDAARFPRLLRQANDAEVADVRKVGEDDYEISPHRMSMASPSMAAGCRAAAPSAGAPAPEDVPAGRPRRPRSRRGRENGQRFGLRFRRGSRGPLRAGEIPLIGVVQIEAPVAAEPVGVAVAEAEPAAEAPATKKPDPRPGTAEEGGRSRPPRPRAGADEAAA